VARRGRRAGQASAVVAEPSTLAASNGEEAVAWARKSGCCAQYWAMAEA